MTIPIQSRAVTPGPVAAAAAPAGPNAQAVETQAFQVPKAVLEAPKENTAVPKFDPEQMQKQLEEVVKRLNEQMKENQRDLSFAIDNRINTFIITVRHSVTGEVIRQIPNEVAVNFAHRLEDLKGVLFNEKT